MKHSMSMYATMADRDAAIAANAATDSAGNLKSPEVPDLAKLALEFTLLVERNLRGDLPDGVSPVSDSELSDAMYKLRAVATSADGERRPASSLLLRRAMRQIERWSEKYGEFQPDWLPPAGDVELLEDIDAHLKSTDANPVQQLIERHFTLIEAGDEYAYFELAYTRQTGWMAWLTDKPLSSGPVINPDRKVLARGQGRTAAEACAMALKAKS